jgi:hypothetical protein
MNGTKVLNNLNPVTMRLGQVLEEERREPSLREMISLGAAITAKRKKVKKPLRGKALKKVKGKKKSKLKAVGSWFSAMFGKGKAVAGKAASIAAGLGIKAGFQQEIERMAADSQQYAAICEQVNAMRKAVASGKDMVNADVLKPRLDAAISEVYGPALQAKTKLLALAEVGRRAVEGVMAGKPSATAFGAFYAQKAQLRLASVSTLKAKLSSATSIYEQLMQAPAPAPSTASMPVGWSSGSGGGTGFTTPVTGSGGGGTEESLTDLIKSGEAKVAPAEQVSDLKKNLPLILGAVILVGAGAAYMGKKR